VAVAPRQVPDEPAVHGAEGEFAVFGPLPSPVHVVEEPLDLGAGEVGVQNQPCFLLEQIQVALILEAVADVGRAAILPDDGVVDRFAGLAVPDNRRLSLVGNADSGDVRRAHPRSTECFGGRPDLRGPNLVGVMFDPARIGINLFKLFLRNGLDLSALGEENGPRTRRALIESKYEPHET